MNHLLYFQKASFSHQATEHGRDAQMAPVWREALPHSLQRQGDHSANTLKGGAGREWHFSLNHNHHATRSQEAPALLQELGPHSRSHKAEDKAGLYQVKRAIGKVQGVSRVHHAKMGIGFPFSDGNGASIVDHASANIEASHLHAWIGLRHLKNPGARATGNV